MTAEGSLNQVNDNLQRIRELTVQAANGTNSKEDLDFNGVRVLSDEAEALTIQVGANDNQTITVSLTDFDVTEAFSPVVKTVSSVDETTTPVITDINID